MPAPQMKSTSPRACARSRRSGIAESPGPSEMTLSSIAGLDAKSFRPSIVNYPVRRIARLCDPPQRHSRAATLDAGSRRRHNNGGKRYQEVGEAARDGCPLGEA